MWNRLAIDAKDIFSNFLLCLLSRSGRKVFRPLPTTLHAEKPNDVLHFEYFYLNVSDNVEKYAFFIKVDFRGYAWLTAASNAGATHAVEISSRWKRTLTAPMCSVSDKGTHFMNDLLASMSNNSNIQHKPTAAYSPWVHETVERLNCDILAGLRAILIKLKLAPQNWNFTINNLLSIFNESPAPRLIKCLDGTTWSPLQIVTGH